MYHPWEQERRKYAEVGKSLLKSNVNLNCYSDLKPTPRQFSIHSIAWYLLTVAISSSCSSSSPHHYNHLHHIIIITNVNIIIILIWCNDRYRSSKLPSMKEQTRNLEHGLPATTIFVYWTEFLVYGSSLATPSRESTFSLSFLKGALSDDSQFIEGQTYFEIFVI